MTAYQLGKILGVGKPTVYYWLWGKSVPNVDNMLKLIDVLHISAQEVLEMFSKKGGRPMTAKEFIFGNRGTQSLIALKMGVGRQAVSNWCTGKNIPTARNIIKMTKALEELGVQTNEAEIFSIFSEIEKKAE